VSLFKHLAKRIALVTTLAACSAVAQAAPVIGQGTWQSTLLARDISGNPVALNSASAAFFYDTTLNITWLADMNLNGAMTWAHAQSWAGSLQVGGHTGWRLPTTFDTGTLGCDFSYDGGTHCGYNVLTQTGSVFSEWAHLYYVTLGNLASCAPGGGTPSTCEAPQPGWGLSNTAYFQNFGGFQHLALSDYWYGTGSVSSGEAWRFFAGVGRQDLGSTGFFLRAVAVRSGDVLSGNTVPEPQSLLMVLTALVGVGVALGKSRTTLSSLA
jgi:hypothetical protein